MYENITYEDILDRMLAKVPDEMDKREGSIIYDALAPAAIELQIMYLQFDQIIADTFAETASREYLIRRVAERGIIPFKASKAKLKAITSPSDLNVPKGARFSLDKLNYIIIEKTTEGEYVVECEVPGEIGNQYFGNLIPINYIEGLEEIKITELLIPGEDEESDESIRKRYFKTFDTKPFGGNKADYKQKTNAIKGVGATKVKPVWNGGGTVLLTILDSQYQKASNKLVQTVQEVIDPTPQGKGNGIAPIGHTVTVRTADEVVINLDLNITFAEGYSYNGQKESIKEQVETYFKEIRKNWENEDTVIVRISQIDTRILNVTGVIDVNNTKINGKNSNLQLDEYSIPVMGVIKNA